MNPQIEQALINYFEGQLSAEEKRKIDLLVMKNAEVQQAFEEYQTLYTEMDDAPIHMPSPVLKQKFNHWLEEQQAKAYEQKAVTVDNPRTIRLPKNWQWAAAAALFILTTSFAYLISNNWSQQNQITALAEEMQNTRKMLALSMLDQSSASQRIKAMNEISQKIELVDPQIINALVHSMQTDENINVRITAAEALVNFAGNQGVTEGLIEALEKEEDPRVQITLIEALVSIGAGKAVNPLQELLQQDTIVPVVKESAARGLDILM